MSLNNIALAPLLINELFKNCLVEFKVKKLSESILPVSSFNILGNNKKKIIIIVENDDTLYLPDDQLSFLLCILSACKLTMDDVAIINLKKNKAISYKAIELDLKAEKIILFGVSPSQIKLPMEFPLYQVQPYNNQTYIMATILSHIQNDKVEKTKLWNCLKQIF